MKLKDFAREMVKEGAVRKDPLYFLGKTVSNIPLSKLRVSKKLRQYFNLAGQKGINTMSAKEWLRWTRQSGR